MNARLWGENPKQYSFLCLIYVNHESFHKWNKRYCERLVLPGHARAHSPTQSILHLTASARTRDHAHRHLFFFFFFFFRTAPTFLLIASVSCGATVHALLETSSQVMLCQLHAVTSAAVQQHRHGRREAKECVWLCETLQETKGKLLWAVLLKKKKKKIQKLS